MKIQIHPHTRVRLIGLAAVTAAGALAAPAGAHHPARSDAVAVWNANAGRAAVAACISPAPNPLHESRLYAMTHVAIHEPSTRSIAAPSRTRSPAGRGAEHRSTPPWPRRHAA